MKKSYLLLLISLSVVYFFGIALGFTFLSETLGSLFKSWSSGFEKKDSLLDLRLSLQHLFIALIAAVPVSITVVKNIKKNVFLPSIIIALPAILPVVIMLYLSEHDYNLAIVVKDQLIIALTPALLSLLLVKLHKFKNNEATNCISNN